MVVQLYITVSVLSYIGFVMPFTRIMSDMMLKMTVSPLPGIVRVTSAPVIGTTNFTLTFAMVWKKLSFYMPATTHRTTKASFIKMAVVAKSCGREMWVAIVFAERE